MCKYKALFNYRYLEGSIFFNIKFCRKNERKKFSYALPPAVQFLTSILTGCCGFCNWYKISNRFTIGFPRMRKFSDNHQVSTSTVHSVNLRKKNLNFCFTQWIFTHNILILCQQNILHTHTHTHTHTHSILFGWLNASVHLGRYKDKIPTSEWSREYYKILC